MSVNHVPADWYETILARVRELQAERDNWEAACSGSIKEQFRLARENEARLKLALEQLDKAATEIKLWRERVEEGAMIIEANVTEIARLQAALREDRKYLAGLCGCAASSGCGAAIRRVEIDRLLNSEQKATDER